MTAAAKSHPESDKGELRRQQVLDAATECFRREGFHGSSIARISQAAAMSPGHIYHYFANKEAIVEAIAEREEHDMAELVRQMEQDQEGGDLVARLTRHTAEAVERNSNPDHVGLMLELAAEAARNPAVARILQRTDRAIDTRFLDMARHVGIPAGMDEVELRLRMGMIAAMFQGLAMRSRVDPERDRAATVRLADEMIRSLFGAAR
ncbi:Transcriptional regulator, TetR family [plant metagenome]|uniref:Transcriptional regulator, TetR family n=1 Tax=plant metagenome TaxID=1297885 RepID=A0A484P943_9ZZZZ